MNQLRYKPMAKHRTYSIEFERQVAQEFLAGETLHGLSKRHDFCRNPIRVWFRSTKLELSTTTLRPPTCSSNTTRIAAWNASSASRCRSIGGC
jgi:transposase-like protein